MSKVVHHRCSRCQGTGKVRMAVGLRRCPVCLGLGEYETNASYTRPPKHDGTFIVLHSGLDPYDAIEMLPVKEGTDDREG